jgi:hypothetical protein
MNRLEQIEISANTLEQRLWVAAREIALQEKTEFTVACAANVKDFIRAGVKNMARESRQIDADLEIAESNLTLWVKSMVETAKLNPIANNGLRPIREGALVLAKRLCPLWPFA